MSQRLDIDEAMRRVPAALEEHRAGFREVFGREVSGAIEAYRTEDADRIMIASGTVSVTLRDVVDAWRRRGERVGMIRIKMFNPFPGEAIRELCRGAARIGILDRNYSAGTGGLFCQEVRASLQGSGSQLVQGYLSGVGGGDVVPDLVDQAVQDLGCREAAGEPLWMGIEP
jgi:pyruvate/2-oxoacid:ferredoxin oxidoreductase alpha subunit